MRPDRKAKSSATASISMQLQSSLKVPETLEPFNESKRNVAANEEDDDNDDRPLRQSIGAISPKKKPRIKKEKPGSAMELQEEFDINEEHSDPASNTLYARLRASKVNIKTLISRWIAKYSVDQEAACCDLHNLVVECSGCPQPLSLHMWRKDYTDVLAQMTTDFTESSAGGSYPLGSSGPGLKKFKSTLTEFFRQLIDSCHGTILYDGFMLERFTNFLGAMADSQVRAFRHTGTYIVMKVMTGLVKSMTKVETALDSAQRQLDAERAKAREKASKEKLATLQKNLSMLEDQLEELKRVIVSSFKAVYIHRYRDVFPEIRILCMEEAGQWMLLHPAFFLDDSYLKYIGWTLSDKFGDVRLSCLKALEPLYDHEELKHKLELFTGRFKRRFVEMTFDKEMEVSVRAAKLLTKIDELYPEILEPRECESIYELVFSRHGDVAHAAGEFVHHRLFSAAVEPSQNDISVLSSILPVTSEEEETDKPEEPSSQSTPSESNGPRRSARSRTKVNATPTKNARSAQKKQLSTPNAECLRILANFIVQSGLHQHSSYVVDSLWSVSPMLKDWGTMVQILLNDSDEINQVSSKKIESSITPCTAMVDILVSTARQAATNEAPPGRDTHHHTKTSRDMNKQLQAERRRLSEILIPALPLMLSKFVADFEKVSLLLELPAFFDLEVYTKNRLEKSMDATLRCLADIVQRHVDSEILGAVAGTFEIFCDDKYNISTRCLIARNNLLDTTTSTFQNAFQELSQRDWSSGHGSKLVYATLFSCIKKLAAFFQHHDLTKWQINESCLTIMKLASERKILPDEAETIEAATKYILEHLDFYFTDYVVFSLADVSICRSHGLIIICEKMKMI